MGGGGGGEVVVTGLSILNGRGLVFKYSSFGSENGLVQMGVRKRGSFGGSEWKQREGALGLRWKTEGALGLRWETEGALGVQNGNRERELWA